MFTLKTFAIVFAATSALAHSCTRTYTVKEGDICDTISAANQVSTYQLAVVNKGHIDETCSNLMPGDSLCLGQEGEDCSTTYVIQPNDTCDTITQAHGLNSTILYLNNPQISQSCDNLYVGEVLCVGQAVQVPVTPDGVLPASTIPDNATPANPSYSPVTVDPTPAPAPAPAPEPTPTPAPAPAPAPAPSKSNSNNNNTNTNKGDNHEDNTDEDCDDDDKNDNEDNLDDEDLPYCDEI